MITYNILNMKQIVFNCCLLAWLIGLTIYSVNESRKAPPDIEFELKLNDSEFMKDWTADANTMLSACIYYDIKYPSIVTAQAILESGNFNSELFRKYNNPFGLYNSKKKEYFKFKHWTDAILAYQAMIEYKFKGRTRKDYYKFLERLPYATSSKYIDKVKAIESNLPP